MNPEPKHQKYYQGMYNKQLIENDDLSRENTRIKRANIKLMCVIGALGLAQILSVVL